MRLGRRWRLRRGAEALGHARERRCDRADWSLLCRGRQRRLASRRLGWCHAGGAITGRCRASPRARPGRLDMPGLMRHRRGETVVPDIGQSPVAGLVVLVGQVSRLTLAVERPTWGRHPFPCQRGIAAGLKEFLVPEPLLVVMAALV